MTEGGTDDVDAAAPDEDAANAEVDEESDALLLVDAESEDEADELETAVLFPLALTLPVAMLLLFPEAETLADVDAELVNDALPLMLVTEDDENGPLAELVVATLLVV